MPPIFRKNDPLHHTQNDQRDGHGHDNSNGSEDSLLRPYIFHGLDLSRISGQPGQWLAECPFCGKNKFTINEKTGIFRCLVCGEGSDKGGGNIYTFLRLLHKYSLQETKEYSDILRHRKILEEPTAKKWELVKSLFSGEWLVPGYGADGKLNQLYKYAEIPYTGKRRLYPTPGCHHHIHGASASLFDSSKPVLYLTEGPWDAMVLWEILNHAKPGDTLSYTKDKKQSLISQANVLAVPGAQTFNESWLPLFAGKQVVILYDSDHPRKMCRQCKESYSIVQGEKCPKCGGVSNTPISRPAGFSGMRKVINMLSFAEQPPERIMYLPWGPEGYDPTKPSGYDIRDYLTQAETMEDRVTLLDTVLSSVEAVPAEWIDGNSKDAKPGRIQISTLECTSWQTLIKAWEKALNLTEGLKKALACMLSSIVSTPLLGDPLWFRIVGPPASGKSTLCEALSVNRRWVLAKSSMTGFYSGYKTDRDGEQDHSLISMLADKCLITKDGDTLMQSPNIDEILGDARDFYDGVSRKFFRNGIDREYALRMTWIIAGTGALRVLDKSELGERFLTATIMDAIEEDLEEDILWRVVTRSANNVMLKSDRDSNSQYDPALLHAMQLTGGYIDYLHDNAEQMMSTLSEDPIEHLKAIMDYARFVSYLRARPSSKQDESVEREMATRLASQLTRLAKCLAIVMNRPCIDKEVMEKVREVTIDTSKGKTFRMVEEIYAKQVLGIETAALVILGFGHTEDKVKDLLKFLKIIGVVELCTTKINGVEIARAQRWRLTPRFLAIYKRVMRL